MVELLCVQRLVLPGNIEALAPQPKLQIIMSGSGLDCGACLGAQSAH